MKLTATRPSTQNSSFFQLFWSIWEHIGKNLKALYLPEPLVKDDYVIGYQFNTKRPEKVGTNLTGGAVRVQYLGTKIRIFMSRGYRLHFKPANEINAENTVIDCDFQENTLKLYSPKGKRLPTLESFFRQAP